MGSKPIYVPSYAEVAQLVERKPEEFRVGSSILSLGTSIDTVVVELVPYQTPNLKDPGQNQGDCANFW